MRCSPDQLLAPIAVDWSAAAAVLGKLQAFLPELARANEALEETDPERSGFELERVDEPEEVLTRDADLALTASDIAEAADPAEGSDGEQEAEAADEADGEPPAIHMVRAPPPLPARSLFRSPLRVAQDLYCGVLEEKAEQAESLGGGLKLPSGVEISSGHGSDSDSDEEEEAEGSLSKRRKKALVQELPARSTDAA